MSFFVLISTRRFTCWKNFCAGVFVFESGASDEKSCPEPLGRNPVARVWMAQVEVCRESCRRRSVLEQRNATSLNVHPVCWNDVAWSIPPPHLHHHHPRSSSPTVKTAAALLRERERTKKPSKANSVLSLLLSFSGTDFFFFHSLTSCSLSAPPSSGGVSCFALLLPHGAAHADPRREGGGEKLNAHLLPKIVYDVRSLLYLSVQQVSWEDNLDRILLSHGPFQCKWHFNNDIA